LPQGLPEKIRFQRLLADLALKLGAAPPLVAVPHHTLQIR